MVRDKRDFKVVDAKTGEDITHNVLTQIIMDEEARGTNMLPVNFLRQLIGMYGESVQSMVPQYLEASLEALQRNQSQFRDAVSGAIAVNPFAELARRNMEMFTAATAGLAPAAAKEPEAGETKSELAELRAQLADMQKKLDRLGE
jgi:polyhydroxyalkanoate synthesis repressor PhaR